MPIRLIKGNIPSPDPAALEEVEAFVRAFESLTPEGASVADDDISVDSATEMGTGTEQAGPDDADVVQRSKFA